MDSNLERGTNQMGLGRGLAIYLVCLGIWLLMFKLALDTNWFPTGALISYHMVAGFGLNRWVLRGLIQWHPVHGTLDAVAKAKLSAFFLWPLTYAGLFVRLLINEVL
jgi:hypothetical protein